MGRHINEKYTKKKLNQLIFTDSKPTTKFLFIAKGVEDYIFARIFKQKEVTIYKDCINFRTKFSSASKPIEDIILIEKLNEISGF